jgi:magnesium transporter
MGASFSIARRYATAHPEAAAKRLSSIPAEGAAAFLADVEPEVAAIVLKRMWPGSADAVLAHLAIDSKVRVVETLDLTNVVVLLRQMQDDSRDAIIDALPEPLGRRVRHALALRPGTAGSVVDSSVSPFHVEATVAEVRSLGTDPRIPYLYVVDPEHRLVGVIHRRELEQADDRVALRSIMNTRVQTITATAPLAGLLNHGAWSHLDALPVIDARGTFLGIIRHKSLRASPHASAGASRSVAAVEALLDLGEVYWSTLYSAVETFAAIGPARVNGDPR